jgi:hypothetical protein
MSVSDAPRRHQRGLVWTAALAALALGGPGMAASASGAVLIITGEFRMGDMDRLAGNQTLELLAGRDLRQMVLCSTVTTDANGAFTFFVPPQPACTDRGYNNGRGPVSLYIVWRGQQVGAVSTHFDPDAPRDKTIRALAYARFSPLPSVDPLGDLGDAPARMVARRFYGSVVTSDDRPVTTPVTVTVKNRGIPCGTTRTQADGRFMLDLATDPACACPTRTGGTHFPTFHFEVAGRVVLSRNLHMHYDAPQTMGKIEMITLRATVARQDERFNVDQRQGGLLRGSDQRQEDGTMRIAPVLPSSARD